MSGTVRHIAYMTATHCGTLTFRIELWNIFLRSMWKPMQMSWKRTRMSPRLRHKNCHLPHQRHQKRLRMQSLTQPKSRLNQKKQPKLNQNDQTLQIHSRLEHPPTLYRLYRHFPQHNLFMVLLCKSRLILSPFVYTLSPKTGFQWTKKTMRYIFNGKSCSLFR